MCLYDPINAAVPEERVDLYFSFLINAIQLIDYGCSNHKYLNQEVSEGRM